MARKKKNEVWTDNGFEEWGGYMAAKKAKLEEQFHKEADREHKNASDLFQGIAIFVNGYTDPTADELRRLMMEYGGTYHHYLRPQVTTHIIASNLPHSKIVLYRKSKNPIPICKPEWITDSIKAGKVLNFQSYLLYTNCTDTQPKLNFKITSNSNLIADNAVNKSENNNQDAQNNLNNAKIDTSETIVQENKENPVQLNTVKNNARCTKDSEFLTEFYNNSRLHHISTMGATFKDYVNELRDKSNGKFPGLEYLIKQKKLGQPGPSNMCDTDSDDEVLYFDNDNIKKNNSRPIIMHIDMDCFFVSVGLRNKPELKGLPVAVAHAKGNKQPGTINTGNNPEAEEFGSLSEVASCSYEARKMGVKNGMFLGEALKLCPNLKTIPYDFEGYKEVSYSLYNTVASYTLDIEAVSCDELYADCSKILKASGLSPLEFANIIRKEIKEKTGCPVSTGFGNNKLQARLATKKAKPDGQFYLNETQVQVFIGTFNVRDLPGVGGATAHKLNKINVNTCAELQTINLGILQKEFGKKIGETLYNMCRGIDHSKLNLEHVRKSVSAEVNYGIRFENNGDAVEFLKKLCEEVSSRLKKANAKGRCITLKMMVRHKEAPKETTKFMGHGLCDYFTKSKNCVSSTDDVGIITKEIISIWNQLKQVPEDVRGIGIQISRLEILKQKVNNTNLINFVNKSRQVDWSNRYNKINKINTLQTIPIQKTDTHKKSENRISAKPNITNSEDNLEIVLPSQELDESVFNALPDDIKTEIVNAKRKKQNEKKTDQKQNSGIKEMVERDQSTIINTPGTSAGTNKELLQEKIGNPTSENIITDKEECPVAEIIDETPKASQESNKSSSSDSNMQIIVPSQEIDESVLNELPKSIRNKIITEKQNRAMKKTKKSDTQTRQEDFFKQTKSTSGNSRKVEMPPIEEIDMSVLIELPEDIRNEVLNEYKARKQQSKEKVPTNHGTLNIQKVNCSTVQERNPIQKNTNNENLSFSQIDPEFLAALSEEMRNDVRMYCMAKKKEKDLKNKQNVKEPSISKSSRNWNILKREKNNEKVTKAKSNLKSGKSTVKNKKKNIKESAQSTERKRENQLEEENVNQRKECNKSPAACFKTFTTGLSQATEDEARAIILHNQSISENSENKDNQEMLVNFVNHFFSLPLEQIKMQIQTWIANSKTVNEVDFLLLATFLSMLPGKKRIEDLHVLLKTMHRCMTKSGSCIWHRTYRKIVKYVQQYMQIEYNSDLMVPPMRCNLSRCNSDDVILFSTI